MAIVFNGTVNQLPQNQIPTGYTRPTVTTFNDAEYDREDVLTVTKATVEDATNATTLTNIFNNGTVGLNVQITAIITADYINSNNVEAYSILSALTTNTGSTVNGNNDWLNNNPTVYQATVKTFIKTS